MQSPAYRSTFLRTAISAVTVQILVLLNDCNALLPTNTSLLQYRAYLTKQFVRDLPKYSPAQISSLCTSRDTHSSPKRTRCSLQKRRHYGLAPHSICSKIQKLAI